MDITVVIPLFNEAESLRELHARIVTALEASGKSFDVLFIDDGSRDGSFDALRRLREEDARVRAIRFRRNYGKSAA
ncbi:MAG: glycosyltransferase, partial [Gemmatimonadetes bacterium]|nr:glycosyltransferase [Gemmatimonadota bacterium]